MTASFHIEQLTTVRLKGTDRVSNSLPENCGTGSLTVVRMKGTDRGS